MKAITLIHMVCIGTHSIRVGVRMLKRLRRRKGQVVNPIFLDSAVTTAEDLPAGLEKRFTAISTDPRWPDLASRNPERFQWAHLLNDLTRYSAPPDGLGFAHEPDNAVIAITSRPEAVMRTLDHWRHEGLREARQRSDETAAVREVWLLVAEPYGATGGGGLPVVAAMLKLANPRATVYGFASLPNQAVVGGETLEEYRAKFYDLMAMLRSADAREMFLHQDLDLFPVDILFVANTARLPEVASSADLEAVMAQELEGVVVAERQFAVRSIDCHAMGREQPLRRREDQPVPRRLVMVGTEKVVFDGKGVLELIQRRAGRALAGGLLGDGMPGAPITAAVIGAFSDMARRAGATRDAFLADNSALAASASLHNYAAVRASIPVLVGRLNGRSNLFTTSLKDLIKQAARNGSVAAALIDLRGAQVALVERLDGVNASMAKCEADLKQAQEFYDHIAADKPRPAVVANWINKEFRATVEKAVLAQLGATAAEWGRSLAEVGVRLEAVKAVAEIELGGEEAVFADLGPGATPLVTEALIDRVAGPTLDELAQPVEAEQTLIRCLADDDPAAAFAARARETVQAFADLTASEWAARRFSDHTRRVSLLAGVRQRLELAELEPVLDAPARRHLWVYPDEGFAQFGMDLGGAVGGDLNEQGGQPLEVLPGSAGRAELMVVSMWLGLHPGHLSDVHRFAAAWGARREVDFGFAVTSPDNRPGLVPRVSRGEQCHRPPTVDRRPVPVTGEGRDGDWFATELARADSQIRRRVANPPN